MLKIHVLSVLHILEWFLEIISKVLQINLHLNIWYRLKLSQRIYRASPLSIIPLLSQPIICRAPAALEFISELFMKVLSHTFCGACGGTCTVSVGPPVFKAPASLCKLAILLYVCLEIPLQVGHPDFETNYTVRATITVFAKSLNAFLINAW